MPRVDLERCETAVRAKATEQTHAFVTIYDKTPDTFLLESSAALVRELRLARKVVEAVRSGLAVFDDTRSKYGGIVSAVVEQTRPALAEYDRGTGE